MPAARINLDFVLGNKVMVGTVNGNREYFEAAIRDLAMAQAQYSGWAERLLTFVDPERDAVKGLGLQTLPAFVVVDMADKIGAVAEGWDPVAWRAAVGQLALILDWTKPAIPGPRAPGPYPGTPALAS